MRILTKIRRNGSSLTVAVTKVCREMDLREGDDVTVEIKKAIVDVKEEE